MSLTKDQTPTDEWKQDLETERLITNKNQYSVLHICPKHKTSCYTPLSNDCVDCKLYLSGEDIRYLLAQAELKGARKERERTEKAAGRLIDFNEEKGWPAAYKSGSDAGAGFTIGYTAALDELLESLSQKETV